MCKLQRFGFQRTEYRKSLQYQQLAFGMSVCLLERMGVNQHHAIDHVHVCKQRYACIIDGKQTQESHCPHAKNMYGLASTSSVGKNTKIH